MADPADGAGSGSAPEPAAAERDRRRRTFGPVFLLGLASAALAAVACAKPWIGGGDTGSSQDASLTLLDQGAKYPVASAVSLVLLAAWGVLLVTRRHVRRAFAVLAVVAAVGVVLTVITGHATLPASTNDTFDQAMGHDGSGTGFTGWFWTAAVVSVIAVVPGVLAVRLVPHWPEMGTRYDAPGAAAETADDAAPETERDLWHALDEGRDPTDRGDDAPR